MSVSKLSVSLPEDVHRWAEEKSQREGVPMSALIAEALRGEWKRELQADALRRSLSELLDSPLTPEELSSAESELDRVCARLLTV